MTHFGAQPINSSMMDSTSNSLHLGDEDKQYDAQVSCVDDLKRMLSDSSKFICKISFSNCTRIARCKQEYLAVVPFARGQCANETNAVAVWVEGDALTSLFSSQDAKEEKRVAKKAVAVFKKLIALSGPTYAAITFEDGLPTPCELRIDHKTRAFRDFYMSRGEYCERFFRDLVVGYPECSHEDFQDGVLTLTNKLFRSGQNNVSLDRQASLSNFVGKQISQSKR
jgi:hypothetical protein